MKMTIPHMIPIQSYNYSSSAAFVKLMIVNFDDPVDVFSPRRISFNVRIVIKICSASWIGTSGIHFRKPSVDATKRIRLTVNSHVNEITPVRIPALKLARLEANASDRVTSPIVSILVGSVFDNPGNCSLSKFRFTSSFGKNGLVQDLVVIGFSVDDLMLL